MSIRDSSEARVTLRKENVTWVTFVGRGEPSAGSLSLDELYTNNRKVQKLKDAERTIRVQLSKRQAWSRSLWSRTCEVDCAALHVSADTARDLIQKIFDMMETPTTIKEVKGKPNMLRVTLSKSSYDEKIHAIESLAQTLGGGYQR